MASRTNRIINPLIVVFVLVTTATTLAGKIIYVDDDGPADFNNIQAAIDDSNDGDTIIVVDGTYTGVGNREISFHGKAITLRSENGPENCIIDCQGKGKGFYFRDGEDANSILSGLTITNGYSSGCGALYINRYSSPKIINCKFENNHGGSGGAIDCHSNYSPKLTNCIFNGNSSHYSGGGIFISEGSPILTNCTFSGNSAGDYGGAIHCEETSSPTIRNCLIIGNKTECDGGGISNTDGSDAIIENCTITDNIANGKGGGIYSPDRMTVINSILWGSYPDQITRNYRIVINYSDVEGGWSDVGNFDEDPCFVDPGYWDVNGTPQDANDDFWVGGDYRLLWESPCIDTGDPDYIPEPNETDLDGWPRVNGGRIDMGVYEFLRVPQIIYVDADATGANDGSSWADAYNFLQDALADPAASVKPVEIRVAQGVYTPDSNTSEPNGSGDRKATFQLTKGVTLKGGYAGFGAPDPNERNIKLYDTILSGDLGHNDVGELADPSRNENSFHVVTASNIKKSVVLDGFIIQSGNANDYPSFSVGGGMHNKQSSPTVINCTFTKNTAHYAGAMSNRDGSNPVVTDCTFIDNYAPGGGGGAIYYWHSGGSLNNCYFKYNSGRHGGAIRIYACNITITNCLFADNYSSGGEGGGAVYLEHCTAFFKLCTLSGNAADGFGGGIFNRSDKSNFTLQSCVLWNNSDIGGIDESAQVHSAPAKATINYTCLQGWTGDFGGIGNIDADPCFVQPGYWDANGTPQDVNDDFWVDGDYHLLWDSPCIDAGDPNYVPEPNETDLDGKTRIINDRVDMGAYEYISHVQAYIRIVPRTINLASSGKWISSFLKLPEDYKVADIDPSNVFLENEIESERLWLSEDNQTAIVKFSRDDVQTILEVGEIELTITGRLMDGTVFEGTDTITVTDKKSKEKK